MFLVAQSKNSGLKINGCFKLLSRHFFLCVYAYFTLQENNDVPTTVFNVTENFYFEFKKTHKKQRQLKKFIKYTLPFAFQLSWPR